MGGPISPCVARISLIEAGRMLHRASGRLKPLPTPAPSVRLHKRGLDWVEPARCPNRDTLQIHLQGAPSAIHMHRWPCARLSCVCKADGSGTTHCRRLSHLQTNRGDPTCTEWRESRGLLVGGSTRPCLGPWAWVRWSEDRAKQLVRCA